MAYDKIKVPAGDKITVADNGKLQVSENPIVGFIEGDGIGPDITAASMHIWNSAVSKAYGNKRKIAWMELFAGEKANAVYGKPVWLPEETADHSRRRRHPFTERGTASAARSLCLRPPGALFQGSPLTCEGS